MKQEQGTIQFRDVSNMSSYRKTANRITQLKQKPLTVEEPWI